MKVYFEFFLILVIMVGFVFIRSLYFDESLNFSTDQAVFAQRAMELWQNKEITLVGPTASLSYQGRFLIQSSVIFYVTLVFLLLGDFQPLLASYVFVLFASAMCWPLYFGMRKLFNPAGALLATASYAFLPFFVDYTRFLWNPNYQLALVPLLIFCFGTWWEKNERPWLFASGLMAGFLLLFHYQFVIPIGLLTLFLVYRRITFKDFLAWVAGGGLGFSPMILFELKSGFYLSQTVWLIVQHGTGAVVGDKTSFPAHYVLSIVFLGLCLVLGFAAQKAKNFITYKNAMFVGWLLFFYALALYKNQPLHAFGMPKRWNYVLEEKAFTIVKNQQVQNYAVANTLYETKAAVQYYLLRRDQVSGWTDDYRSNQYLFVIGKSGKTSFADESAYELSTFQPARLVNYWELSPSSSLYLFERTATAE